jgi:arylsulfatase A-like enzyme
MTLTRIACWRWSVAALLGVGLAACGDPRGGSRAVSFRLISDDPEPQFDRSALVETERVFEWTFRSAADLDGWESSVEPDEVSVSEEGLGLRPRRQFVTISRSVDLEAAEIDALELRVRGLRRHPVTLEWAGPGEDFAGDRKITLEHGRDETGGFKIYRLVTAGHPRWRGTISQLRFSLVLPKVRKIVVDRISGLVESIPGDRLADAVGRSWKVELGQDVRNARLAVPGVPIRSRVDLPAGAELWLEYGLQPRLTGPVRFVATAVRSDGSRRIVLDDRLEGPDAGWRDARIDLGGLAGETVELELSTSVEDEFEPELGFPLWANPEVVGTARERRPNVILVSIDTLRADHLSLYGYHRSTSPHLDAWARARAAVFDNVVAAAPWTLPSHVSIFSGLDALRHGVNQNQAAPAAMTLLGEVLRPAGYATLAVTGGGFVHPQFGFAQGFDRYWSFGIRMGSEEELEVEVTEACDVLERYARRPFFLFLHTYEVHNPFRPRQPYFSAFSEAPADATVDVTGLPQSAEDGFQEHRGLVLLRNGEDPQPLGEDQLDLALDLYDAGIAYTDSMLARVLRRLEHLGIEDQTVVVVTSDHGELFGEHGEFNHVSLYDENLLVPLIIVDPRRERPVRIPDQVRLIDVMPTVLDLLDVEAPGDLDGVSLVPLMDGGEQAAEAGTAWSYAAASNRGVALREGNRTKYTARVVPWPFVGPVERLYDLAADPGELLGDPESGPALEDLRRRTAGVLEERLPGVRLRLAAGPDARGLSGEFAVDGFLAQRVKTLRPGCNCLRYESPSEARFDIPPGETVDLVLDDVGPTLTLRLDPPDARSGPFDATIDLVGLERVARAVADRGGWALDTGDEPAPHGVSVWWHRRWPGQTPGGSIDESLREQLQALGYVQ